MPTGASVLDPATSTVIAVVPQPGALPTQARTRLGDYSHGSSSLFALLRAAQDEILSRKACDTLRQCGEPDTTCCGPCCGARSSQANCVFANCQGAVLSLLHGCTADHDVAMAEHFANLQQKQLALNRKLRALEVCVGSDCHTLRSSIFRLCPRCCSLWLLFQQPSGAVT